MTPSHHRQFIPKYFDFFFISQEHFFPSMFDLPWGGNGLLSGILLCVEGYHAEALLNIFFFFSVTEIKIPVHVVFCICGVGSYTHPQDTRILWCTMLFWIFTCFIFHKGCIKILRMKKFRRQSHMYQCVENVICYVLQLTWLCEHLRCTKITQFVVTGYC